MVDVMGDLFGSCTNHGECTRGMPKEISLDFIAYLNRDYVKAKVKNRALSWPALTRPVSPAAPHRAGSPARPTEYRRPIAAGKVGHQVDRVGSARQ
jgi:hypothetical protein